MTNQYIWLGITVGVLSFVIGVGVSYAILATTPDHETIQVKNQQLFNQMMSQNPKMAQQWMSLMMENEEFMHDMTEAMAERGMIPESAHGPGQEMMGMSPAEEHETMLELMEQIMEDEHLSEHMMAHMIENQKFVHQMFTFMEQRAELMDHMEAHVTGNMTGFEMLESEE